MEQKTLSIVARARDEASKELKKVQAEVDRTAAAVNKASSGVSKFSDNFAAAGSAITGFGKGVSNVGGSIMSFGNTVQDAGSKVSSMGSDINRMALPAFAALSGGIAKVSKMAWDQVSSVEQATVAFNAYEKDAGKVDKTLKDLLAYARSDMGVLFNRSDLFSAAQGLKVMGAETDKLTGYVEIMSRSVGLGLQDWDTLGRIIGRVGSTGKMTGIDFDMLTKSGYQLDRSMRNTNVTWDELFAALDKGIPADAMAGQADTITGMGIRIQSAFRGIGMSILGVDADTSKFIKGGAGDQLINLMKQIPEIMKDPEMQAGFQRLGQSISSFAATAIPIMINVIKWIGQNSDVILKVTAVWLAFGTSMKIVGSVMKSIGTMIKLVGAIVKGVGLAIQVAGGIVKGVGLLFKGFALAIKGVGMALTFLAAHPAILIFIAIAAVIAGLAFLIIKNWDTLKGWFDTLWQAIMTGVQAFIDWIQPAINVFVEIITTAFNVLLAVLKPIFNAIKFIAQVVFVAIMGIIILQLNIWKALFDGFLAAVKFIWNAIKAPVMAVLGFIGNLIKTYVEIWVAVIRTIINVVRVIFTAVFNTIKAVITPVVAFFRAVFTGAINAVKSIWNGITGFFRTVISGISNVFGSVVNIVTSPFKAAFNGIAKLWNNSIGKLEFKAPDWVPGIGGKGFSMPKLPMLATGALVTGPTMAWVGEGRYDEAVLPLAGPQLAKVGEAIADAIEPSQESGGGDVNVHVEVHGNVIGDPSSVRSLAVQIGQLLQKEMKAQGTNNVNMLRVTP